MYGGFPFCPGSEVSCPAIRIRDWWAWELCPKGLRRTPLHYALFSDRLWTREDISVREWLGKYARQRYGFAPKAVVKALEVLSSSIYNPVRSQEGCTESIICARPSWNVRKASTWSSGERYYHLGDIVKAARGYLKAANDQPNLVKKGDVSL